MHTTAPGTTDNIILYAHRGSTLLAPENTRPAFELALRHGADVLEIDVRLSSDGQVIVIHDESVDRTCSGHGRVRELTLKQLKSMDAAYRFTDLDGSTGRHQGTQLLTLKELFELFPDTPINIDIKDNAHEAARAVAGVVEQCGRMDDTNVGSFHASALAHFRAILPNVTTAATQSEVAQLYFRRALYQKPPFQYLQIPTNYYGIPLATRSFIKHASKRQIKCVFWTINNLHVMQKLIEFQASGFVTDRVDIAGKLLGRVT